MSETTTRRPARHATAGPDDAVAALARRSRLATLADADPQQMLRAASVPLVAAALVAAGQSGAEAATAERPTSSPATGSPLATDVVTAKAAQQTTARQATARQAMARTATARTAPASTPPSGITYTVRAGDNVATIAARVKISPQAIIDANHLGARAVIRPGQQLVLPGVRPPASTPTVTAKVPPVVYTVRSGDTLSDIATRYRITLAALTKANKISQSTAIRPGQKLVLPGVAAVSVAATPAQPPTHPYTVVAGDTLTGIAHQQKVSLADILSLNHLTTSAVIHPGQKLLLPGPPPSAVPNTFLGRTYPDAVARAAAANRATLAARKVPTRDQMQAIVARAAKALGVDPALAQAIAYQESGFNQRVVSPANAIGTMQVIPSTGAWASQLVGRTLDLLNPNDNATAGVAVLAALLAQADDEGQAIAGYYQGLGSVRANGLYDDTRRYVVSVQTLKARFAKGAAPTTTPPTGQHAPAKQPSATKTPASVAKSVTKPVTKP